ncbi:MAG: 30S ribosomal protein S4 [Candidatus Thermoplasmatota archaeon]|nr:30S ribosomal protein S4 [Candidatus Thermoplasmatota archaeon]
MGEPKRSRRKYQKPSHPWQGERIKREDEYVRKYGLKNKKEFWKAESLLRAQRAQAREYLPRVLRNEPQAKRESEALLGKLNRLGVLQENAGLDDVLALDVDAILSRRLQTVAYMKGLAATPKQARQFISHGHIAISGRRMTVPGYLVPRELEQAIEYAPTSPLQNEAHPLRPGAADVVAQPPEPEPEEAEEAETDEEPETSEATDEAASDDEAGSTDEEEASEAPEAEEVEATEESEDEAAEDDEETTGGDAE